jgi:hypothetical protein
MEKTTTNNRVSMGRNPNYELTCGFPRCGHLKSEQDRSGGWCQHPGNRVPPCDGWPNGFTPSVASTGGCDLHTSTAASVMEKEQDREGADGVEGRTK